MDFSTIDLFDNLNQPGNLCRAIFFPNWLQNTWMLGIFS